MRHLGPLTMRRIARGMAGLGRSSLLLAWLVTGAFGAAAHGGGLLREVYTDIPGARLDDLFNSAKYPDRPDLTEILPEFEAPTDVMDDYGQRLRGFLVPPVTGDYVFWIAGDDESVLYLSSTTSPADAVDIAAVPDWTSSREWTKYPSQQSGVIWLDASRVYYIEALMKEGGGGDNLAVRWQLPGGAIEEPIPEARLVPFGTVLTPPVIRTQPANQAVIEGQPAVFTVSVNNPDPVQYQWQRGGVAIPGATSASYTLPSARLADHGASFRCTITNSLGSALSAAAALSVQPDVDPPLLRQAHNVGARTVVVTFSEPVDY
ncbi:MAG TPA: immunoglobulin domain-containing protein, partial [Verrucomicrobiota bacterium]|nr:immunoglobulin domain-containing protein [Verrucomicrobiota bacterium]